MLNVYAPNSQINKIEWNIIYWQVEESLTYEPINMYRFRWNNIKRLKTINNKDKVNTKDGLFSFETINNNLKGLSIYKDDNKIAKINEITWLIDIVWLWFEIKILSSRFINNRFPVIELYEWIKKIYSQYLMVNNVEKIELVDNFSNELADWIYIKFINKTNYNFFTTPNSIQYNPSSFSIYRLTDVDKNPLFSLFTDWRINTLNKFYTLKYSTFWDFIVIKLLDKHYNREIAEVLYKINWDYIME
jgi:hypothetical protein